MRKFICPKKDVPLIWLNVDEFATADSSHTIMTVLGSCVGIILFDLDKSIFGVNHYLNSESGNLLNIALLNEMKKKGCKQISAVVAGGANKDHLTFPVGKDNIQTAELFLSQHDIPIVKKCTGGKTGITITVKLDKNGINFSHEVHEFNTSVKEEINNVISTRFSKANDALENFKKIYENSMEKKHKTP
jgi:chemotaxis protein CheD